MTKRKLKTLITTKLKKINAIIISNTETDLTVFSARVYVGNYTISVHENTLGLVTHINLSFGVNMKKKPIPDYICNIYPHEFDTIEDLIDQIHAKELFANKDLKHRWWVFKQLQRQVRINFPSRISQHA